MYQYIVSVSLYIGRIFNINYLFLADAALSRLRVTPAAQERNRTRLLSGTISLNNDSESQNPGQGGESPRIREPVTDQDGSVYSLDTNKPGEVQKCFIILNVNFIFFTVNIIHK